MYPAISVIGLKKIFISRHTAESLPWPAYLTTNITAACNSTHHPLLNVYTNIPIMNNVQHFAITWQQHLVITWILEFIL